MPTLHWEKHEHDNQCTYGRHLPYRVRKANWVAVHCKVCYHVDIEFYEHSPLTMRKEAA